LNGQVEAQYTGPGGVQEIDQDAFFRPVTVYNNTIYEKNLTLLLLTRALRYAKIARGVAQISVPNDIQKQPLEARSCIRESCLCSPDILPSDDMMKTAGLAINNAKKPVILAGWGSFPDGQLVLALAERIKAPILTTFRAKGILPEDNPWVIGILGNVGSPHARNLVNESDLVITLGVGFSKYTNVPTDKSFVQVDIDPLKLGKNQKTIALWGNCSLVLPMLLPLLQEKEDRGIQKLLVAIKKEWDLQRESEADSSASPLRPPFIMKVLSDLIPEDAVISLDVGENQWWFGRNFHMKKQRFAMSGYLATMGFGLPGAIAAKIAFPDRHVFCITGDGGFSMAMPDFITAVKYNLPIVVIVLNNHQLGMIQVEQMMEHYPNYATDLLNPDFARYSEVCGGIGISVRQPGELKPAIASAMAAGRPVIIDIETDPKRF
jgi:pyruvate oxidase